MVRSADEGNFFSTARKKKKKKKKKKGRKGKWGRGGARQHHPLREKRLYSSVPTKRKRMLEGKGRQILWKKSYLRPRLFRLLKRRGLPPVEKGGEETPSSAEKGKEHFERCPSFWPRESPISRQRGNCGAGEKGIGSE